MNQILILILGLFAVVIGITIHEFSHALSADLLGDPTARYMGRVTLNPIAHFDPFGALMILFSSLTGVGFGWGKPVPVNPANMRVGPRLGIALTSLAGPFSNLFLATLCAIPLRLNVPLPEIPYIILYVLILANLGLALFNLLPIPPLDGFGVLSGIVGTIRARWAYDLSGLLDRVERTGPMLFILLILIDRVLPGPGIIGGILGPVRDLLLRVILG